MSWYYTYYVGFEREGKIYPFGPYTAEGKLRPVISRSRSFASDLHNRFYDISKEMVSEEFRNEFLKDSEGDEEEELRDLAYLSYLPIDELPKGDYVKRGYFLIDEVEKYEKDPSDAYMTSPISPVIYAKKMENELKFGPNKPKKDAYGDEYYEPNASDYTYYAYPDYECEEYEAERIRNVAYSLYDYDYNFDKSGAKLVVILSQG